MEAQLKTKIKHKMFSTHVDISAEIRENLVENLNQTLANAFDLKSMYKQAHWNVKGIHFIELHLLFDEAAAEMEPFIDSLAERITSLGGVALGTVRMSSSATRLAEMPTDVFEGKAMVAAIVERVGAFANHVRKNVDVTDEWDRDTSDLYTEISRAVDKRLWFFEAHIQG